MTSERADWQPASLVLALAAMMVVADVMPVTESLVNRITARGAFNNIVMFAFVGLVGGLVFDALRAWFGLEPRDTAYALLAMPIYFALAMLNLALVIIVNPGVRGRIIRDT